MVRLYLPMLPAWHHTSITRPLKFANNLIICMPRSSNVAKHIVRVIFMSHFGRHRRRFHINLPNDLTFFHCRHRFGFGTFHPFHFFFGDPCFANAASLARCKSSSKTFLGNTRFIIPILAVVHCQFEKFFIILSEIPAVFCHFLTILVQFDPDSSSAGLRP